MTDEDPMVALVLETTIHGEPFTWRVSDSHPHELCEGRPEARGAVRGRLLPYPGIRPWVWEVITGNVRAATGISVSLSQARAAVEGLVALEEHDWEDKP